VYFASMLTGFSLELGIVGTRGQKLGWCGYLPEKKFDDIFSGVDTIQQRQRQTEGRTDTGRQQRPRVRLASHGKNW